MSDLDPTGAKRTKLVELSKTSEIATYALARIYELEAEQESMLLHHSEELSDAELATADQRKLVAAIEDLVQARLAKAYVDGDHRMLGAMELLVSDIAKAKADFT
jgi:hypothetical protein